MVVWETRVGQSAPIRGAGQLPRLAPRAHPAFSGLAAFDDFSSTLTGYGEAQRVRAVSTSANFFDVLGVQARLGRVHGRRRRSSGRAASGRAQRRVVASAVRRIARRDRQADHPQQHPPHHRRRAGSGFLDGDDQRPGSLDDRRPRHPAQLSVSGRHHHRSRFAHHRGDRPPRAGRHARSGAGAAHERDGGAVVTPSRHQRRSRRQRASVARGNRRRHPAGDSADPDRRGRAAADRVRERRASAPRPGRRPAGGDLAACRDGRRSLTDRQAAPDRDLDHRGAGRRRRTVGGDGRRSGPGGRGAREPAAPLGDRRSTRRPSVSRSS